MRRGRREELQTETERLRFGRIYTSITAFRIVGKPDPKFDRIRTPRRTREASGGGCKTWLKRGAGRGDVAELISVIVTTYNREDALDAVLRSLARQDDSHFEIIVADDGSGEATAKLSTPGKRNSVAVSITSGTLTAVSGRRKSATAPFWPPAAFIVFFWTVIALCGQTLSPPIVGWRSPDGLSPAIAFYSRRNSRRKCCGKSSTLEVGALDVGSPNAGVAVSIACRRCCICRSGPCAGSVNGPGKAQDHAISPFGGQILIALMASMRTTAGGVRKIPISSFACYMLASVARMGRLQRACSIFGIETPIVRSCPRMSGSSPGLPLVIASAHGRVYRRFRARLQLPRP